MKAGRSNAIVNLLQRNDSLMATWREGKDERKKTSDQEGMKSLESTPSTQGIGWLTG